MKSAIILILVLIPLFAFAQEDITVTTYYPSPSGSYFELRAKRLAIGDTYFDNGQYSWEAPLSNIPADVDLFVERDTIIGPQYPGWMMTQRLLVNYSGGGSPRDIGILALGRSYGIYAKEFSTSPGSGAAVYGDGGRSVGIRGTSSFSDGVYGEGTVGVRGKSTSGVGVSGSSTSSSGVVGSSTSGYGVYGTTVSASGVYGSSSGGGGDGVHGQALGAAGIGVSASGGWRGISAYGGNQGIYATSPAYAGWFDGQVNVVGNVTVTGTVYATSSRTAKTNISTLSQKDYQGILQKLEKVDVVRYYLKNQTDSHLAKRHIGIIAEDAPEEIISKDKKAVDINDYLGFLLAAVKAQNEEIKTLKQEVEKLKEDK